MSTLKSILLFAMICLSSAKLEALECPDLLRVTGDEVANKLDRAIDESIYALHQGDTAVFSKALGILEGYQSTPIAGHLALIVPLLVFRLGDVDLLFRVMKNLQLQEWHLLQNESLAPEKMSEKFELFLEALEEINYLRITEYDADEVYSIWPLLLENPVSYGNARWLDHLHRIYIKMRSELSYVPIPEEFRSDASRLPELIEEDMKSDEDRGFAIFFTRLVYVSFELVGREDLSVYSPLARVWAQNQELPGPTFDVKTAQELIEAFFESRNEDEEEEEGSDLDFFSLANPNPPWSDEDSQHVNEAEDKIHELLSDIYNDLEDNTRFDVEEIQGFEGFHPALLSQPYHIEDADPTSESEMYLTPLQILVLGGYFIEAQDLQKFLHENRTEISNWVLPPHPYPIDPDPSLEDSAMPPG